MDGMRYFGLLYRDAEAYGDDPFRALMEQPMLWVGWADDLDHAEAQLEDAEPGAIVVWSYAKDEKATDSEMSELVLSSWYGEIERAGVPF